jgi:hypothetical protein
MIARQVGRRSGTRHRGRIARTRIVRGRVAAILGLLVFIYGMVMGPLVHLVGHRDDHDHVPGGPREDFGRAREPPLHQRAHRHGGHPHRHEHGHHAQAAQEERAAAGDFHPDDDDDDPEGPNDVGEGRRHHHHSPRDPEHGRGSLEHFGAATTAAPLFVFAPLSARVPDARPQDPESAIVERYELAPLQPRAPPS